EEVRSTLLRLATMGPAIDGLTPEERGIRSLFGPDPAPEVFLEAADEKRIRCQRGLRERFGEGLHTAGRYFPAMERIFQEHDLPVELTRLPLIESCFDVRAYSKVGAAGIWQFMPKTGRLYKLRVTKHVDERRDPIASTRGAARFLDQLHDNLGTWPLAITAWNHGPAGMARAVREVGTEDIAAIVQEYQSRSFGFASRNFYAEFLAALDVERHATAYFPHHPVVQEPAASDQDQDEGEIVPAGIRQPAPAREAVAGPTRAKTHHGGRGKPRRVKVANARSGRAKTQPEHSGQVAKLPDA